MDKHLDIDHDKLRMVKEFLGAKSDKQALEMALDHVISHIEIEKAIDSVFKTNPGFLDD